MKCSRCGFFTRTVVESGNEQYCSRCQCDDVVKAWSKERYAIVSHLGREIAFWPTFRLHFPVSATFFTLVFLVGGLLSFSWPSAILLAIGALAFTWLANVGTVYVLMLWLEHWNVLRLTVDDQSLVLERGSKRVEVSLDDFQRIDIKNHTCHRNIRLHGCEAIVVRLRLNTGKIKELPIPFFTNSEFDSLVDLIKSGYTESSDVGEEFD